MDRGLALVLTLAVGGLVATQAPANALLARHTGDIAAAFVSLVIATVIVGVILLAAGEAGGLKEIGAFRPEHALGGIAGAAIVYVTIVTVRPLGAGALAAALVASQIIVAAVLDRLGLLGLEETSFTAAQVTGFVLLIAGTVLVTSP